MKPSALLTAAGVLTHALPPPLPDHTPVPLPSPLNWRAGHTLFPARVLEGFDAPYAQHTMRTWALHVLAACVDMHDCNSTVSFAVIDEETRAIKWVGYAFGGEHATQLDYNRSSRVHDSVAYNVLRLPGA